MCLLLIIEHVRGDVTDNTREVPRAEFAKVPITAGGAEGTGWDNIILVLHMNR